VFDLLDDLVAMSRLLSDERQNNEFEVAVVEHAAQAATVAMTPPAPMAALVLMAETFPMPGAAHAALALEMSMKHAFSVCISIYLIKRYIETTPRQEAAHKTGLGLTRAPRRRQVRAIDFRSADRWPTSGCFRRAS
jgi:hypothetical protein